MKPFEIEGTELLARAFCHEIDHLDGHMYVEKVEGELTDVEEVEDAIVKSDLTDMSDIMMEMLKELKE